MWQCVIQFITMVTQNTAVQENQIYITTIEYTQNKEKKAELKKLTYIDTYSTCFNHVHTYFIVTIIHELYQSLYKNFLKKILKINYLDYTYKRMLVM